LASEPPACVFCRIRDGEIPSEFVYEDDRSFVIRDINPQAPTHLLVIPKEHIEAVSTLTPASLPLMGYLTGVANNVAKTAGIANSGYRLVLNDGPDARNEVPHLHLHVLGGKLLGYLG
jgi:histidine triad (HIT) family protein